MDHASSALIQLRHTAGSGVVYILDSISKQIFMSLTRPFNYDDYRGQRHLKFGYVDLNQVLRFTVYLQTLVYFKCLDHFKKPFSHEQKIWFACPL